MLIAQEKRKNNIAEYIIYMWQVEDTIRACHFDMNIIEKKIISVYPQAENVKDEIRNWYTNLIIMMQEEGLNESGHLRILSLLVDDMQQLHNRFLTVKNDGVYEAIYKEALPNISAFKKGLQKTEISDVEVCLHALYTLFLLRLRKKNVSPLTENAMKTFSKLMAYLSQKFKNIDTGKEEW